MPAMTRRTCLKLSERSRMGRSENICDAPRWAGQRMLDTNAIEGAGNDFTHKRIWYETFAICMLGVRPRLD